MGRDSTMRVSRGKPRSMQCRGSSTHPVARGGNKAAMPGERCCIACQGGAMRRCDAVRCDAVRCTSLMCFMVILPWRWIRRLSSAS